MFGAVLSCYRSWPGNSVCSNSAIYQREQHVDRRVGSGAAQGQRSIANRRHVAGTLTDPRIHAGLKDGVHDQQPGCPAPRSKIPLPCPLLRLQGPCRSTDVFSSTLPGFCFYSYCAFSGSSSRTTSQYPVCKATRKTVRRVLARCAAVVPKTGLL